MNNMNKPKAIIVDIDGTLKAFFNNYHFLCDNCLEHKY